MRRLSSPTPSSLRRSTGNDETTTFLDMRKQTIRWPWPGPPVETWCSGGHTLQCWIQPDESRREDQQAKCEAVKCSNHFRYRPKGKKGTKRPVPITRVKVLATRFYRLKCGHAPTGVYLKQFSHWVDDICWCCDWVAALPREEPFPHCSRWRVSLKVLWRAVTKVMSWTAGRCGQVQVTELLSKEKSDHVVVDFMAAFAVWKCPPKWMMVWGSLLAGLRSGGQRHHALICCLRFLSSLFYPICKLLFVTGDEW